MPHPAFTTVPAGSERKRTSRIGALKPHTLVLPVTDMRGRPPSVEAPKPAPVQPHAVLSELHRSRLAEFFVGFGILQSADGPSGSWRGWIRAVHRESMRRVYAAIKSPGDSLKVSFAVEGMLALGRRGPPPPEYEI